MLECEPKTGFFLTLFEQLFMNKQLELIKSSIKSIPNHPKEGIIFRDITSLLEVPAAFKATIDLIVEKYKDQGLTK